MGRSAYLTGALGTLAAVALWLALWPLAAVALVFLIGGRREPSTIAGDVLVFAGLAAHADLLWVALLTGASLLAREHDPRAILILLLASIAAMFVTVEWTILAGLLALVAIVRAGRLYVGTARRRLTRGSRPSSAA